MEHNLTVDQKFAKAMLKLKDLRPFYSSIYEVMNKTETARIDTMAVDGSQMLYNYKFCDELDFDEFLFVVLHELTHIALLHVPRCKGRDIKLWNIACDLYSNKLLHDEFGDGIFGIRMPDSAVYFEGISIDDDSVETIYDELYEQAKQNGYFGSRSTSSNGLPDEQSDENQNSDNFKQFNFKIERDGKKYEISIGVEYRYDLVLSEGNSAALESEARKILSDAQIRNQLLNGALCGSEAGVLERLCQKILESKIDWRKLIRKHLIAYRQSDMSYGKPDKRMYWQSAIYPGPVPSVPDSVKGVKVCIDTSGSISDNDMEEFISYIFKLTKQFKVDAELIYWDAEIQSAGKITNMTDIKSVKILGGGGTDPSCVFSYLDNNKSKPILTVMLTDGYFSQNALTENIKWKRRYKDTLWIICKSGDKDFKPAFGKVAELKT